MAEKIKIGLIYSYDQNWIGGTYYIENLIHALMGLDLDIRPQIKLYYHKESDKERILKHLLYDDMTLVFVKDISNFLDRAMNKIYLLLTGKYLIIKGVDQDVDTIFPNPVNFHYQKIPQKIYWMPDFQHKYFPELFRNEELKLIEERFNQWSQSKSKLILSSNDSLRDYLKYYPNANTKNYVLPFAVTLPPLESINEGEILDKYQIKYDYFICSNQLWVHKDHKTILQAIAELASKGTIVHVVFTGNLSDHRSSNYYEELLQVIDEMGIDAQVHFLGFLPRIDQLILMKKSICIIQASQFEGWSTVVEDSKALNKEIILSDLPVHKEQLPGYNGFFKTGASDSLSVQVIRAIKGEIKKPNVSYNDSRKEFGKNFMSMINDLENS